MQHVYRPGRSIKWILRVGFYLVALQWAEYLEASTQISYIVGENSTSGAADVKRIFCGLASRWFYFVVKNIWFRVQASSWWNRLGRVKHPLGRMRKTLGENCFYRSFRTNKVGMSTWTCLGFKVLGEEVGNASCKHLLTILIACLNNYTLSTPNCNTIDTQCVLTRVSLCVSTIIHSAHLDVKCRSANQECILGSQLHRLSNPTSDAHVYLFTL